MRHGGKQAAYEVGPLVKTNMKKGEGDENYIQSQKAYKAHRILENITYVYCDESTIVIVDRIADLSPPH